MQKMPLTRLNYLCYLLPAIFYLALNDDPVYYANILNQSTFPAIQLLVSIVLFCVLLLIRVRLHTSPPTGPSTANYSSTTKNQLIPTHEPPSDAMLHALISVAALLGILLLFLIIY